LGAHFINEGGYMNKKNVPTYDEMMNPIIRVLRNLGGSATIDEMESKVSEEMKVSDQQLDVIHNPEKGGGTEFGYRLAWARSYLKRYGILENSERGVWSLTSKGRNVEKVDEKMVVSTVRDEIRKEQKEKEEEEPEDIVEIPETDWRQELIGILQEIKPDAFERLIQRMLRESGFTQVEVIGRRGDNGIDGQGILRLGGLLSFHVLFQAKRWKGSVPPGEIRDFRGAMVGRADKGLFITTGYFTKEAIKEATRDGAPAIDLIDGEQLINKLKELKLGVDIKKVEVENVLIDNQWFQSL
jgi:restriction system protein